MKKALSSCDILDSLESRGKKISREWLCKIAGISFPGKNELTTGEVKFLLEFVNIYRCHAWIRKTAKDMPGVHKIGKIMMIPLSCVYDIAQTKDGRSLRGRSPRKPVTAEREYRSAYGFYSRRRDDSKRVSWAKKYGRNLRVRVDKLDD